jgi:hypothetical protein
MEVWTLHQLLIGLFLRAYEGGFGINWVQLLFIGLFLREFYKVGILSYLYSHFPSFSPKNKRPKQWTDDGSEVISKVTVAANNNPQTW